MEPDDYENRKLRAKEQSFLMRTRLGCFVTGTGLVFAAVVDAAFNPLAFIEAPQLLASGVGLMVVGATGKAGGKND